MITAPFTTVPMKIAYFSSQPFEIPFYETATHSHEISFYNYHLNEDTVILAKNHQAVCCFVNDKLTRPVLEKLSEQGIQLIALRSAGYNHVDLQACQELAITVVNVPKYSPYAVAEHALGLILALNRKIHRAYNRVREHDFSLHGLLGFDIHGKTIGVIGTGYIGSQFCRILQGFGVQILACDPVEDPTLMTAGVQYCEFERVIAESDIISIHCPLNKSTHHLINKDIINQMKPGIMLINTSRGGLIESNALIQALKSQQIGALGIDVYEEEGPLFFEDHSDAILTDDTLARLLTFPNVIVTGHQAFFTQEALTNIALTTLENITQFETHVPLSNQITLEDE